MNTTISRAITAAVVRGKGAPFTLEEVNIREPEGAEVLVRVVATGMCHTDLIVRDQLYPVPLPLVLGHEGAGVVEAIGPNVTRLAVGDHVVMSYGFCGGCSPCDHGHMSYCKEFFGRNFGGSDADGKCAITDRQGEAVHDHFFAQSSFATYAISTEDSAVKVPKEAPLELLGPLGCGIQTGAGAVINTLGVRPGSRFAALGAGAVGLSAVMAARVAGAAMIIAIDVVPERLALAMELGATHVINASHEDVVERVRELGGGGVDYALESTGRTEVLRQGVDVLAGRGTLGVVGAPPLGHEAAFDVNDLLLGGKSIRGIVEGDSVARDFIPQLVELHRQGRFPFDRLVKFYDFEDINQAAEDSERGLTLKPILRMAR
ncbi:NAD(P)-dependent alcohol dehydrogenase [Larsenimonas rhizosphaerae]|uniref:NAD(P)-dependent alcohol dehydrogenase n=1 Tax=Larsenimonas rhizosphaerae TaxID=2944682 RepID=A0AA42CXT5_9GAMM|nr:NAD(P)-dependent alcohol dehydrogenase [Larsenimonas rhizosphaerae]MCX2524258.1 NAD(P)-dependent alcohol dehydrogenase [Larsenimonas rhizosphaerae]